MHRPCLLILDREQAGSISTRKLVLETAKLNVITAYTGQEGLQMLARFPAVDGIVLDAGMPDMDCSELIGALKAKQPALPLILIETSAHFGNGADYVLESFDPTRLLDLLRKLLPGAAAAMQHEEELYREEKG